ncbi:MAG: hypothetical protein ACLSWI_00870 [Candidatus Gastranaerophilaceae bacterium]
MKISPISKFLVNNNAVAKNITRQSVDFYNPNNNYLGSMTRILNNPNYKFTSVITFNEKLQKNYYKTVKQYFERIYLESKTQDEGKYIAKTIVTEIVEKDYIKGTSRKIIKEKVLETPLKRSQDYIDITNIFESSPRIKYSSFNIIEDTVKSI